MLFSRIKKATGATFVTGEKFAKIEFSTLGWGGGVRVQIQCKQMYFSPPSDHETHQYVRRMFVRPDDSAAIHERHAARPMGAMADAHLRAELARAQTNLMATPPSKPPRPRWCPPGRAWAPTMLVRKEGEMAYALSREVPDDSARSTTTSTSRDELYKPQTPWVATSEAGVPHPQLAWQAACTPPSMPRSSSVRGASPRSVSLTGSTPRRQQRPQHATRAATRVRGRGVATRVAARIAARLPARNYEWEPPLVY